MSNVAAFNPAMTGDALRRAAGSVPTVGAKRPTIKVMIEFDPETGDCEILAPNNPAVFYGILKVAEKTFDRMQAKPAPGADGGKQQ